MLDMVVGAIAAFLPPIGLWLAQVQHQVPNPYLDEVFHIPQAQAYCAGQWSTWDSKITTPPGLYLIAWLLRPLFGCSTGALRLENAICLSLVAVVVLRLLIDGFRARQGAPKDVSSQALRHAANIALFPPLFFFSALYYTDVASTLSVLVFHYFSRIFGARRSAVQSVILFIIGLYSLLFRQTNIFWVAIFPAATTLISTIDVGHDVVKRSMYEGSAGFGDSLFSIVKTSWKMKVVYDPPIHGSTMFDYVAVIASTAACLLSTILSGTRLPDLITALAPYLGLILAFSIFVFWNGSVVLGDKSNHVATLHVPQMLYIWPYILFFSWPLVYDRLLGIVLSVLPRSIIRHIPLVVISGISASRPKLRYLITFVLIASAVIKYNTIIHPFTLADNRHYTFYVFRLLMRPRWIRYAVTPVYAISAWACIQALGSRQHAGTTPTKVKTTRVSFALIWLATSALQLVTAPLVEPRYFILPWVFWRLALTEALEDVTSPADSSNSATRGAKKATAHRTRSQQHDYHLWVETGWFLVVNAVTGYIFLHWKFTWLSEPGKWQRFMW